MQLVVAIIFVVSLITLIGAILFGAVWHQARLEDTTAPILRDSIGDIGISAIIEYPSTTAPLLALLEEEYPRCEVIVITDLQQHAKRFQPIIQRHHLVKVNHSHLNAVHNLYRSRYRNSRRISLVDIPYHHRTMARDIATEIATFDHALYLEGDSEVARGAITLCANFIATQGLLSNIAVRSMIGAKAYLASCSPAEEQNSTIRTTHRALAWHKGGGTITATALFVPLATSLIALIVEDILLILSAGMLYIAMVPTLYISCVVMAEKSLFSTFGIIICNIYRFLLEKSKNLNYLYKESQGTDYKTDSEKRTFDRIDNKRESI